MAENDSESKSCLNLIGVSGLYIVLISALVVSLFALLSSTSISPLIVGIVVLIALLVGFGVLCLMYCIMGNKLFLIVLIICIRSWCGCVLGLMSFVDISGIQNDVKTAITWMLLVSIGYKAIWSICQRCFGLIKYSPSPVTWAEMIELAVFSVTGLMVLLVDQALFSKYSVYALFLILVSFAVIVVAVRLVACFYNPFIIFILITVILCQVVFFKTVDVPFYDAALCCFAGRLFIDPVLDLFSSNISIKERLNCVFSIRGCLQKMFIIIVIVFEGVFLFHAGVSFIYHKAWYWIILFVVLLLLWIFYHSYFIHLCWHFSNKMSECTKAYQALNGNTSMDMMMATKGMRLQAQLTHCLIKKTFASTLLLGVLGAVTLLIPSGVQPWHKDDKAALAASYVIVLLVEASFYTATDALRKSLPGACTACVIIPPSKSLEQLQLEELPRRSIIDFFDHIAIPCSMDSFVDGLSLQTLKGNLDSFFAQTISDTGQRYDSYVVYYCGKVDSDGMWELTEG